MRIIINIIIIIIIIVIVVIVICLDYKLLKKKSPWQDSALLHIWKNMEPFLSWRL
jgi:predicted Holliday junction resolvase-like endonuclease